MQDSSILGTERNSWWSKGWWHCDFPWILVASIFFLTDRFPSNLLSLGIQSPCQMMIGVYNHLLSKVFRFHYHSQKVIGSLGYINFHTARTPETNPLNKTKKKNKKTHKGGGLTDSVALIFRGGTRWAQKTSYKSGWNNYTDFGVISPQLCIHLFSAI